MMSDKKPTKHVEPSPFDKFMEEVRGWFATREKRQSVKRLEKAEHFNETRHIRRRGSSARRTVFGFFAIIGMMIWGFIKFFLGMFRFAIWIGAIAGFIWLLTMMDMTTDEKMDEVKKQVTEVTEKTGGQVGDVIRNIADEINKIKENWHIEIRSKGEDGETKVMEFGTKQDDPPEPPEKP